MQSNFSGNTSTFFLRSIAFPPVTMRPTYIMHVNDLKILKKYLRSMEQQILLVGFDSHLGTFPIAGRWGLELEHEHEHEVRGGGEEGRQRQHWPRATELS